MRHLITPAIYEIPLPGDNTVYPGKGLHRYVACFESLGIAVEYTLHVKQPDESLVPDSIKARKLTAEDEIRTKRKEQLPNGKSEHDYDGWPIIEAALGELKEQLESLHKHAW